MNIEIRFPGGLRVDAVVGPHVIRTDQPPSAGGEGSAPTPFATFLASIGACAGIYALGFCRQRGLATDGLRIEQAMELDPATGMVSGIRLDVHAPPGFPEKYRAALVRAMEQCTVKKHLAAPPRITISLASPVESAA